MRSAHTVDEVRRAEAALMATLPGGVLMQRAAAGLAYAVLDLLGNGLNGSGSVGVANAPIVTESAVLPRP
mgnify:CR=1 FL=1